MDPVNVLHFNLQEELRSVSMRQYPFVLLRQLLFDKLYPSLVEDVPSSNQLQPLKRCLLRNNLWYHLLRNSPSKLAVKVQIRVDFSHLITLPVCLSFPSRIWQASS